MRQIQVQLQVTLSEAASSDSHLQQSRQELKTEEERLAKLRSKVAALRGSPRLQSNGALTDNNNAGDIITLSYVGRTVSRYFRQNPSPPRQLCQCSMGSSSHQKREFAFFSIAFSLVSFQVDQRMMLQSESLTGLQQIMEERSVQLCNQEERIHQRDDLLSKARGSSSSCRYLGYTPLSFSGDISYICRN